MMAAFDEGDCQQSADGPNVAMEGVDGSLDSSSSFDGFDTGHSADEE